MPAAVRTIYSSPIRQSAGIQVECRTALRRTSSGLLSAVSEESRLKSYVVTDVPGSRRGSTKTTAFRGSILGGADQADSRLSFVVPLIELILDGFSANRDRSFGERWQQGLWPPCFLILCTWATYPISHQESFSFP
jgi:hypothetical protein